ncbi:MAG: glycosyltransferase family 4 protein, partial [Akkermansiaceae bacterium]
GLGENFKFLGVLKGNDKWQAYAHADVFFFPSHYQSENFPMVLIEALACGLPIVTTRWRGIPQLMGDSDAAILCDIHAPDDYARELDVLLNDEQRRSLMSEAARIHYGSHFTRSHFIRSMEQVFDELLDRQNALPFVR